MHWESRNPHIITPISHSYFDYISESLYSNWTQTFSHIYNQRHTKTFTNSYQRKSLNKENETTLSNKLRLGLHSGSDRQTIHKPYVFVIYIVKYPTVYACLQFVVVNAALKVWIIFSSPFSFCFIRFTSDKSQIHSFFLCKMNFGFRSPNLFSENRVIQMYCIWAECTWFWDSKLMCGTYDCTIIICLCDCCFCLRSRTAYRKSLPRRT